MFRSYPLNKSIFERVDVFHYCVQTQHSTTKKALSCHQTFLLRGFGCGHKSSCTVTKMLNLPLVTVANTTFLLYTAVTKRTALQEAKRSLHNSIPSTLLCRDEELASLSTFLQTSITARQPGALYISGAPGTGKTACLSHTMENSGVCTQWISEISFLSC